VSPRLAGIGLSLALAASGGGCTLAVVTAKTAGSVATTTVATAGKVTTATVKSTGKVMTSAVSSSGDATALSVDSAAKLARTGMVVSVDAGTGAITRTPWRDGLKLYALVQAHEVARAADFATLFRGDRRAEISLERVRKRVEDYTLRSGDVIEFRRRARN